jgi:hypothetical protein
MAREAMHTGSLVREARRSVDDSIMVKVVCETSQERRSKQPRRRAFSTA